MVGPNYVPPDPWVPEWVDPGHFQVALPEECPPPTRWWEIFNDPFLNKYIDTASCYNNEVQIAEANILRARATRMVTASKLFPQIAADFNASRTYFSKNGPIVSLGTSGINTSSGLPFEVQVPQIQNLFNATIDASWEIDLFGKTRRSVEVADALIGSACELRNDVLVTIFAEVANNYLNIRSQQRLGQLVSENIDLLEKNAEIVRLQVERGYRNQLDLERIEAELLTNQASLPGIYATIYQDIYALSVLTGFLPEVLLEELLPIQPLPMPPPNIAIGVRTDVLRRRPDVRLAERLLAAATAHIGVAVASFFPTITLTGQIGFQSLSLANLFQAGSKTWSIAGDVNLPIFQGGKLIGNLRVSEADALAAAYGYQQAVLNALQEAESGLVAYGQSLQATLIWSETIDKYQGIVDLTSIRYLRGLSNLIDFLDSERQLNSAKQNWLNSVNTSLLDLVALYKALGGGWEPHRL